MSIQETISILIEEGKEVRIIRGTLIMEGYSDKEISAALKEAGVSAKRVSFASEFYKWLEAESRSEYQVEEYVMDPKWGGKEDDKGLTNIQRHLSHYKAIADLARRIHEAK